jgi:hypothetical protein
MIFVVICTNVCYGGFWEGLYVFTGIMILNAKKKFKSQSITKIKKSDIFRVIQIKIFNAIKL